MSKTAILILAAGESKRMGKPKQLLPYNDSTLLSHTIQQTKSIDRSQTFVVVGAYFKEVFDSIRSQSKSITVVINKDWEKGMGSSLSKGIEFIKKKGIYDRVLVTLSDMPLISQEHYEALIEGSVSKAKRIIVTQYKETSGVPAVFDKSLFNELSLLVDDDGAKPLIKKYKKEVSSVITETPYFDVDTSEAYQKLIDLS
mgnify:CR=1 FL=1